MSFVVDARNFGSHLLMERKWFNTNHGPLCNALFMFSSFWYLIKKNSFPRSTRDRDSVGFHIVCNFFLRDKWPTFRP